MRRLSRRELVFDIYNCCLLFDDQERCGAGLGVLKILSAQVAQNPKTTHHVRFCAGLLAPEDLHPPARSITSPLLLVPALRGKPSPPLLSGVPSTLRCNNVRPAGVNASARLLGVVAPGDGTAGGPIDPALPRVLSPPPPPPDKTAKPLGVVPKPCARSRMFRDAFVASRRPISSRRPGSLILKLFGVKSSGASSAPPRARGVPRRVPHVMSSLIALGPRSLGDGEGAAGTRA